MNNEKYLFNSISKMRESFDTRNLCDKSIAGLTEVQLSLERFDLFNSTYSAMDRIDSLSNAITLQEAAAFVEINNFSKSVMDAFGAINLFDKSIAELTEGRLGIDRLGINDSTYSAIGIIDSINGTKALKEATTLAGVNSISKSIMELSPAM